MTAPPRPMRTAYGSSRFNAPGYFAGLDFTADSRALVALVSGKEVSRLVSFSMADGGVVEQRELDGPWTHVRALPGGELILWSVDHVCRLSSSGETLWTIEKPQGLGGAAVALDGALVVTFGEGQSAQLWDGVRGARLRALRGSDGEIFAAAFNPGGDALVTGSSKGVIRLFDTRTGAELAKRKSTKVLALAFSPSGERVLSGHGNGRVALWNAQSLKPVPGLAGQHTFEVGGDAGCRWVAFSPDGESAFSLGNEHRLRAWTVPEGEERLTLAVPQRHPQGSITALSPDGRWVATGSTDGALSVWSTKDGEPQVRDAAPSPLLGLALTPGLVAAASSFASVSWDRTTGRPTSSLARFPPADVKGLSSGLLVRLDYDAIHIGETLDPDIPAAFQLESYASGPLAVSRGETRLAVPIGNGVEIWDLKRSARLATLPHEGSVTACAFGPNDAWIVTADSALHLWRLRDGEPPQAIRDIDLENRSPYALVRGLAVSERGWIAVSVDGTNNNASAESSIRVVDPRSGETVASLDRPGVRLGQVAFAGGTRIAVSDSSGRLLLADALEGRWLDAPDPGTLGFVRYELVAHPIATRGDDVAHVGPDGNVLVSTLPATKAEAGEPFLLELEPQAAGDEATAKAATSAPGGAFEDRLAGKRFFFAGTFKKASKELREVTLKELGASIASRADARVTHVVLGARAKTTDVDALKAKGVQVTRLSEEALLQLLLPTREEALAMLRGEVEEGAERWNAWRVRYHGPGGEDFPAQLVGIDLAGVDLRKLRLEVLDLTEARLAGADLSRVNLFDTVFRGADLREADLSGASCYRTVFTGADLRKARLGADLTHARLDGADLRDADLTHACLKLADLRGADLRGARLPSELDGVKHDAKTRWPEGAKPS